MSDEWINSESSRWARRPTKLERQVLELEKRVAALDERGTVERHPGRDLDLLPRSVPQAMSEISDLRERIRNLERRGWLRRMLGL